MDEPLPALPCGPDRVRHLHLGRGHADQVVDDDHGDDGDDDGEVGDERADLGREEAGRLETLQVSTEIRNDLLIGDSRTFLPIRSSYFITALLCSYVLFIIVNYS